MRTTHAVALLFMAAFVLAGCAGQDNPGSSDSPSNDGGTGATSSEAGSSQPSSSEGAGTSTSVSGTATSGSNHAPSVSFAASIQKGAAPLNVTFTVGGTDPEGSKLSYTLHFGDKTPDATNSSLASGFSSKVRHAYAAGIYNATVTVSDGQLTAKAPLLINATLSGGGAEVVWTCLVDVGAGAGPLEGGSEGVGGKNIGVCTLGTTARTMTLVSHDVTSSCYAKAGSDLIQDGKSYPSGTALKLYCNAGATNQQGSVTMR